MSDHHSKQIRGKWSLIAGRVRREICWIDRWLVRETRDDKIDE